MELYEAMVIISPELEKDGHEEVINGLSATITKNEGTVSTILDWRKRRLAYEIDKKYLEGHYYLVYFSGKGTIIPEIEHYFRVTDTVVRYMVVRTDEQEFEAAAKKAAGEAAAAEKAAAEEAAPKEEAAGDAASVETVETAEPAATPETGEPVEGQDQEEKSKEPESAPEQAEEEKPAGE